MESFKEVIISILFIGLFIVAFISFASMFASDNGSRSIMSAPSINSSFGKLNAQLNNASKTANAQLNVTTSQSPTIGFGSLILLSIPATLTILTSLFTSTFQIIADLIQTNLGVPAIVLSVVIAGIIITIILLFWRLIRIGS